MGKLNNPLIINKFTITIKKLISHSKKDVKSAFY